MGAFGNSLKRELGKNTGKFISNVVFGDMHSTPYRRVDSKRQVVREARLAAGAGYIVILTGKIMTMPGLPKAPAALKIDIDPDGTVHGLF